MLSNKDGEVFVLRCSTRWLCRMKKAARKPPSRSKAGSASCYAALLATLAIVARLQPVAAWIADQDMPERSIPAMPALRAVSSGRPR
jgi:hypothetical protein